LAVLRYINYWNKRVEILQDKAFEPLDDTISNSSEMQMAYELGVMTLLDARDPTGRGIVVYDPSKLDKSKYTVPTIPSTFWYVLHTALQDITVQRKGIVITGDVAHTRYSQFDRPLVKAFLSSLQGAFPVRTSAFHIVHPPAFAAVVFPAVKLFLSDRMKKKKRIQFHYGSDGKIISNLEKQYGLSKSMLPTSIGGTCRI
jgi:hypothetical protein